MNEWADGMADYGGAYTDYPLLWRRTPKNERGYVHLVPCRLLDRGRARLTIAALHADGTEGVRSIRPENLVDPSSARASA